MSRVKLNEINYHLDINIEIEDEQTSSYILLYCIVRQRL